MKGMQRVTANMCEAVLNGMEVFERPFLLRRAKIDDLETILSIGHTCFSYNPPKRREIRHALTKGHGALAVLVEKEKIIGYVAIDAHEGHQALYLNTTAVLPGYRGRGLGRTFYAFADALAKHAFARAISCHVAKGNEAGIALLQNFGYRRLKTIEDYYDDGNAAHVMRKDFV